MLKHHHVNVNQDIFMTRIIIPVQVNKINNLNKYCIKLFFKFVTKFVKIVYTHQTFACHANLITYQIIKVLLNVIVKWDFITTKSPKIVKVNLKEI
jgi:hypothetical protein